MVALVGCRDTTDIEQRVAKLETAQHVPEQHWYCHAMQPSRNTASRGIDDLVVFSTCTGFVNQCDVPSCVVAPAAWCGKAHICTFTEDLCEIEAARENAPCKLVPAAEWTPAVEGRHE